MGMVPLGGTAEQYNKFIHEDFNKWKTLAAKEKALGIVQQKNDVKIDQVEFFWCSLRQAPMV